MVSQNPEKTQRTAAHESPTFGDQSRKILDDVQELGGIAADNLKSQGAELLDGGRDRFKKAQRNLERYIGAHPMKSMLMAIGVGALVGFFVKR